MILTPQEVLVRGIKISAPLALGTSQRLPFWSCISNGISSNCGFPPGNLASIMTA